MSKPKVLARMTRLLKEEPLSVWLVTLALVMNFAAWMIPRGSYRAPTHDPLHVAAFVSAHFASSQSLYYFWHAVTSATVFAALYAGYRVWTLSMELILDRIDL